MTDAARLLRYLIPGGTFVLAFGLWLLFDSQYFAYPWSGITPPDALVATTVLGAASFPLGFLISVFAAGTRWHHGLSLFGWIDDESISKSLPPPRQASGAGSSRFDPLEFDVVVTTFHIDRARSQAGNEEASRRLQGLLDLMNAIANVAMAIGCAMLLIVFTGILSSLWIASNPSADFDGERLMVSLVALAIMSVLFWRLRASQHRVARLAAGYSRMLLGVRMPRRAKKC